MRNVRIDSTTDSALDQRVAGTQGYNTVQLTIVTAQPSIVREDGSIEHAPDDVQTLSGLVPGREYQTSWKAARNLVNKASRARKR